MIQSRVVRLALFLAAILVAVITAYRVGATTTARPVVRQQFIRRLDPNTPDLIVGQPFLNFPTGWTDAAFDDSTWRNATASGPDSGNARLIGFPDARMIWVDESSGPQDFVLFRKTISALSDGMATLYITVDDDFRFYVNGAFIGQDSDANWTTPMSLDFPVHAGDNVVAIEAINIYDGHSCVCAITSNRFPTVTSDSGWRAYGLGAQSLAGSRWAVLDVPGLGISSRFTLRAEVIESNFEWTRFSELQELRGFREVGLTTAARPGQILVQLTGGRCDGAQALIQPGLYRFVVDVTQP